MKKGETVDLGQIIGKIGNTGRSTGKHLHYEIKVNKKAKNPWPFLKIGKNVSEKENEISNNGKSSWLEVECLGACVNAPMMQINQDYFEDLNENKAEEIIKKLLKDEFPEPGSAKNRKNNAPESGKTTLLEVKNA